MKTVRFNDSKEVKRVSNDEAQRLVESNQAHYVPKSVWKSIRNGKPQIEVSDDSIKK